MDASPALGMSATAVPTIADLLAGTAFAALARPRASDPDGWLGAWRALPARPVAYSAGMIDYQHAYLQGAGWTLSDASLVLTNDRRSCGLWPLSLGGAGAPTLTSQGEPIAQPLFAAGTSPHTVKRIVSGALEWLDHVAGALGRPEFRCCEHARPGFADEGLSEFYQQSCRRGARLSHVDHDMYVDLRRELEQIRASWRKSFRPLVTAGLRSWSVHVMGAGEPRHEVWETFRQLHRRVAGRDTRPAPTWEKQWRMIVENEALLVWLEDADSRMVGGGFFQLTDWEALYSVAAYDRDLFDKPLGHVVQARAIEEFKQRGVRWYRLGALKFPEDHDKPSAKDLTIGMFKQGFASHLFAKIVYAQRRSETSG
ncbi:MAG TPA: FemAB family protein [Roseiarcus sp.]|nr:FemAB family protein [Roseiarcus sp.]